MIYLANLILPYDTNAESGVVCTLITNPEMIGLCDSLKANHFHNRELASIFWAIQELTKDGVYEIDMLNLSVKLNEKKGVKRIIDEFGGDKFIKDLIDNAPLASRDTQEEYSVLAKRITELGFRRKLYTSLQSYEKMSIDENIPLGELHSNIVTNLDGVAEEYISNQKVVLFKDKIDDVLAKIEEKRQRGVDGLYGLPWVSKNLTDTVGGMTGGELYLISGRRKSGKSVIMLNEAIHKAQMGLNVLMTSSELTDEKDTLRMLSIISGIPIDDIKLGRFANHNYQKYKDAIHFLKHASFHREYDSVWTPDKVLLKAKTIKHKLGGLDFVVHDYIKDTATMGSAEKSNMLGRYCDVLKNQLAGDMDIPVVAGVQINRAGLIGDSDGIERYATLSVKWEKKTREEIIADGIECGNHKMGVMFARDGHTLEDEEDYLDYYMDLGSTSNLRIYDAKKQHEKDLPDFMND